MMPILILSVTLSVYVSLQHMTWGNCTRLAADLKLKTEVAAPVESVGEKRLPTGKTITRGNLGFYWTFVYPFC